MAVLLIIIFLLLLLIGLLSFLTANFLVNAAVCRHHKWYREGGKGIINPASHSSESAAMDQRRKEQSREGKDYWEAYGQKVTLTSHDHLILAGTLLKTHPQSHKWALLIHGYRSTGQGDTSFVAKKFSEMGYNTLSPDLRAHGESEGEIIGFGWPERLDNRLWVDYLLKEDPHAEILLYGLSMGAASVMMTSGEPLPPQVKGIIADCGYSSLYEEFTYLLKSAFKLPLFPTLPLTSFLMKKKAGYSLKEVSSLEGLSKNTLPALFIHGTGDRFIPPRMAYQNRDATKGIKEVFIVENASHIYSFVYEPEKYFTTINRFISKYIEGRQ